MQISLNIIDIFCLHIFLMILSYCPIDFIVFNESVCTVCRNTFKSKRYTLQQYTRSSYIVVMQK